MIKRRLFENEAIRNRLRRDYGLGPVDDPESLSFALLEALNQPAASDPLRSRFENREVYRAAVHSLGSNSRSWASFLRNRESLEQTLRDYDPSEQPDERQLAALLPGQSGPADAKAILRWRDILANEHNYYSKLVQLGERLRGLGVTEAELLPCVALFIGAPPAERRMHHTLADLYQVKPRASWKAPGMGPVLASEFLRNMGWNGFKPDRHVTRLLGRWAPGVVAEQRDRAAELFIVYSLAGVSVTPPGVSYSVADNLVWALGAYVEKKDAESGLCYINP